MSGWARNNRHTDMPPRCLRCGERPAVRWVEIGTFGQPDRSMPGGLRCLTPGCVDENGSDLVPAERCRICERPIGEVHTAECSPIINAKATAGHPEPHLVSGEDAYPTPAPIENSA